MAAAIALIFLLMVSKALASTCDTTWTNASGGNWDTAGDWSGLVVPDSTMNACITTAGTYTVTIDHNDSAKSLTLGASSGHQNILIVSLNDGLTIASPSVINSDGELDLGSTYGGSAHLDGSGTLTNSGSLITGPGALLRVNFDNGTGGTVEIARSTAVDAATTFTNDGGSVTIDAGQNFHLSGGSALVNLAGTITNNGELQVSGGTFTQRGGSETNNYVTMESSTLDDDTSAGAAGFYFSGSGTLTGTGSNPGVASGQTVVIKNNNIELDLGVDLNNAGTIDVSDSSVGGYAVLGTAAYTLTNTGSLATGSGSYLRLNVDNATGGSVEVGRSASEDSSGGATTFTNDGGNVTIDSGQNLHLSGGSSFANLSGTITNNGEVEVSQGIFTQRAGTETNHYVTMGGGAGSVLDDDTSAGAAGFYFTNESGGSTLTGSGSNPGVASGQAIVIQNNNMSLSLGSGIADFGSIDVSDGSVGGYADLTNNQTLVIEPGGAVIIGPSGTYSQGATGTLGVTVDAVHNTNTGITGGTGTANLDGTLQVTTTGTPALNTTWTVVSVGSVSGTFPTHTFGSVDYSVSYPPGQVVLTAPGLSSTTTTPSTSAGTFSAVPVGGVPAGTSMYDKVTVTGNDSSVNPTGSVKFYVCSPGPTTCSDAGTLFDTETLSGGSGGPVSVFSAGQTMNSQGTWCFAAYYVPADTSPYPASHDATTGECFWVNSSATATQPSTSFGTVVAPPPTGVPLGTTMYDGVTVTGNATGGYPTGTVTFYECGPLASATGCTSTANQVGPIANLGAQSNGMGFSGGFTPPSAGTWCFAGYYGGSTTYPASSDTSSGECFLVTGGSAAPAASLTRGACAFDLDTSVPGSTFRLIFTPDTTTTYRLAASNPGEFYYNAFATGAPNSGGTVTVTLPYPFVTKGTGFVHVYDAVSGTSGTPVCDQPAGNEIPLGSPAPTAVTLTSYGNSPTFASTAGVTVHFTFDSTGLAFVRVHLDYGLKGRSGYTKDAHNNAVGSPTIIDQRSYAFSDSAGGSATGSSENVFKRDPGIGGLVVKSGTGDPLPGVTVRIYDGTGKLLGTVGTDQDGWYAWTFKFSGKTVSFIIKVPAYNLAQTLTTKSNTFVVLNFTVS